MSKHFSRPNYDARWKDLVKAQHRHFMQKFYPALYPQIDFEKGVRFLDKELQKLLADWDKKGYRQGDLLLEYFLKTGKKQLVLVHIEIQHGFDSQLPRRMFITYYRIRDRFPEVPLTAFALYTGPKTPVPLDTYEEVFEGSTLSYRFNTFVVKAQREEALLRSANPIDLAILAGLYVLKIKDDAQRALHYKLKLARLCLEKGYDKQAIRDLIIFVSFLIALPEPQQIEYEKNILQILDMEPIPLIQEDPANARIVEYLLLGKTLEERDMERDKERDMERILISHFELNLKPNIIAKAFGLDLKFVKKVIEEAKKQGRKSSSDKDAAGQDS